MKRKIIVLGASGLLGNSIFQFLSKYDLQSEVQGTLRTATLKKIDRTVKGPMSARYVETNSFEDIQDLLVFKKPDVVINCIGIIKQSEKLRDVKQTLLLNAVLPHRLARICSKTSSRLIHFSSDCVFQGNQGNHSESDSADASDLYGHSKKMGEISYDNHLTLRTSIIGHSLLHGVSLIDWFLNQKGKTIEGYSNVFFSGMPTILIGRILRDYVFDSTSLSGLLHMGLSPISKFDLLSKVNKKYNLNVDIKCNSDTSLNRTLNSELFTRKTGFHSPSWDAAVNLMFDEYHQLHCVRKH